MKTEPNSHNTTQNNKSWKSNFIVWLVTFDKERFYESHSETQSLFFLFGIL
jgi:hypothetical protein